MGYYGEKRESGAALLPPTSLIAANKRDYLPDPCFLYTQGGRLHRHANLSAVTGAQSPRPGYPIPFAVAAHIQLARYRSVFGRILREEAHPIGCYEVKPLVQKRSIFIIGAATSGKVHAAIEKLPRAHTRCRGGRPLDMGDWYEVCLPR